MKLQILSDLHLDFHKDKGRGFIKSMDPTGVDVLVLAGDLAEGICLDYGTMLRSICAKYPHVVMVTGNHELYRGSPESVETLRKSYNASIPNLHWLENEIWEHQGCRFLGCTLWFRQDVFAFRYEDHMADFDVIRDFNPWVYYQNAESIRFLESRMEPGDIVVTHHMPSVRSVAPQFRESGMNIFFVCAMDRVIEEHKPALWVCGHTHTAHSYLAGSTDATQVVCNPLGYPREGESMFKDKLVVDVQSPAFREYRRLMYDMMHGRVLGGR
jgi:Icc-related predicted phosphoesterase